MPTIKEIIKEYLVKNGYGGLYGADCHDCACLLDDLMTCDEPGVDCTSGYKGACTGSGCDGDCDFHIYGEKADALRADEERAAAEKAG